MLLGLLLATIGVAQAQTVGADSTSVSMAGIASATAYIAPQTQPEVTFASLGIATTADLQAISGSQCPNCTCPHGTTQTVTGWKDMGTAYGAMYGQSPSGCTPIALPPIGYQYTTVQKGGGYYCELWQAQYASVCLP